MGALTVWLLVAAVLAVLCLWLSVKKDRAKILKCAEQIPGPPAWPLIGNTLQIGWGSKKYFGYGLHLIEKYGSLTRFWAGPVLVVLVVDPRDVEVVLTSLEHTQKSYMYRFLEPLIGKGLLTSNGERWHKHRKLITPTFHLKTLERSIDIFKKHGEILLSKLMKASDRGYVDVTHLIQIFAQDVICDAAMGIELNSQKEDVKRSHYTQVLNASFEAIMKRVAEPWNHLDKIYYLSPDARKFKKNVQVLHRISELIIKKRKHLLESCYQGDSLNDNEGELRTQRDESKRRYSLLDTLLYAAKENYLTDTDIRDEVNTLMTAGQDTTASAIAFALYELGRNPDIQEKVFLELQEVTNNEGFRLTLKNLQEMKYLEQVIKEVLRLYPTAPLLGRSVAKEIHLPSRNVVLPEGVEIGIPPMLIHRDPELYPNPHVFNPERFSQEAIRKRHPFAYIPFSAGARSCVGQKFAMMEIKAVLAMIVWNFKLVTDPKYKLELLVEITLMSEKGIPISLHPRPKI